MADLFDSLLTEMQDPEPDAFDKLLAEPDEFDRLAAEPDAFDTILTEMEPPADPEPTPIEGEKLEQGVRSFLERAKLNVIKGTEELIDNSLNSVRAFGDYFSNLDKQALEAMPSELQADELKRREESSGASKAITISPEEMKDASANIKAFTEETGAKFPELPDRKGVKGWFDDVVKMGPQIVSMVGSNVATGGAGTMLTIGSQILGGQYDTLVEKGVEPVRAFQASLANATAQAALETIGISKAMSVWKPGKQVTNAFKKMVEVTGVEFLTEWMQAYPEAATGIWAEAEKKGQTPSEQVDEFFKGFWETTKRGLYEGLVTLPYAALPTAGKLALDKISGIDRTTPAPASGPDITEPILDEKQIGDPLAKKTENLKPEEPLVEPVLKTEIASRKKSAKKQDAFDEVLESINIEKEFGTGTAVTKEDRIKATDKFIDETIDRRKKSIPVEEDKRVSTEDRRVDIEGRKLRDAAPNAKKEPWEMSQDEFSNSEGVVHHGTTKDFENFDDMKFGSGTDAGWWGEGHYFHTDKDRGGYGGTVKSARVDLKKPIILPVEKAGEVLYGIVGEKAGLEDSFKNESPMKIIKEIGPKRFTELAQELGYDGVEVNYVQGTKEIVAFKASQIMQHKDVVKQAIKEGKIDSHPDYPDITGEPATHEDAGDKYADTGAGYASTVKNVVDLPEIVDLAKNLGKGMYPKVVKMIGRDPAIRGQFKLADGSILLKADIFEDPATAAKVVSHEIGHLVDNLPDHMINARGNILGRIASLHKYGKHSLPNMKGAPGPLTNGDRARLRYHAKKAAESEGSDKWVDEEIRTELPITPGEVMDVWKAAQEDINPDLLAYVKSLNRAQKKALMKDALKGVARPELQKFARSVITKTGKKIKQELSAEDISKITKQKYADLINAELEKRKLFDLHDITNELKSLSLEWKPFDPAKDVKYTKYRFSGVELYADAFSVLINSPGMLKAKAPKFYEAFFNYLDEKPAVRKEYEAIQRSIERGEVAADRLAGIYDMLDKGDEAYALSMTKAERKGERFMREVVDAHWSLIRKVRQVDPDKINPENNPVYKIENMTYTGSEMELYLSRAMNTITKPLEKEGLTWKDFGVYLYLNRVRTERSEMANPKGHYKGSAEVTLKEFMDSLTDVQKKTIADTHGAFNKLRKYTIDKAEKAGRWHPDMIKIMRDNADYATFDVIKYVKERLGRGPSASISSQLGTLEDVTNPATATVMKDMAIIKATNRMIAAESTTDFLKEHFPDEIQKATTAFNGKAHVIQAAPVGKGLKLVAYLKNGKAEGYYVDEYIADSFEGNPWEARMVGKVLQSLGDPFRKVFTEYNAGFWGFNIYRDYFRAVGNLKGANLRNFMPHYLKALKPAFKSAYGLQDATVDKLLEGNMLISIADYRGDRAADAEDVRLMRRYNMDPKTWRNMVTRPIGNFLNYYTNFGKALERNTKIAGYTYLKEKFPDMPEDVLRHMVRNTGSPDFLRRGRLYPIYNNLLLFSNAIKEGYRGDVEAFTDNKAEWAYKKAKYAVMPKLLMKAAEIGLLGAGAALIMDGVSEYDKTNYTIIPLGLTPEGRSVALRLPIDETGRMIGGISWKLMNEKDSDFFTGLTGYMSGQVPTVNPAISLLGDVASYATGQNPYDSFRQREAIPDQIFEAGGMRSHEAFGKYVWNKSGGGIVYRFGYDDVDKVKTELEEILGYPVINNIIGRFVKVSDQGIKETITKAVKPIRAKRAEINLAAKGAANKLVRGEDMTQDDWLKILEKPDSLDRNMLIALSKKTGLVFVERMLTARSKEEKVEIITQWMNREKRLDELKPSEDGGINWFPKAKEK